MSESTEIIRKKLEKIVEFNIGSPEEVQIAAMILRAIKPGNPGSIPDHVFKDPKKLEASLDKSIAHWELERGTNEDNGIMA